MGTVAMGMGTVEYLQTRGALNAHIPVPMARP
jgi:hypothetical protein